MHQLQHVLFLCSMNRLRSPTAEQVFSCVPGLGARSAGLDDGAARRCTLGDLIWADSVFVMEQRHRSMLGRQFGPALRGRRPILLNIPDRFERMQPELIDLLLAKVPQFLRVPVDAGAIKDLLRLNQADRLPCQ